MAKSDLIKKYNQPPPSSAIERSHQVPHHTHPEGLPKLGVGIRADDLKLDIIDHDTTGMAARIRQLVNAGKGGTGGSATALYVLQNVRCYGSITSGEYAAVHGELTITGDVDINAANPVLAGVFGEVTSGSTGDSVPHLCGVGARAVMTDGDGTAKISGIYVAQPDVESGKADESYGIYIDRQATSGATTKYALVTQSGTSVFNDAGHNNSDLRVKTAGSTAMLLVDASTDTVNIGTAMGSDYARFAVDGELSLHGTARVTKDVWVGASGIQAPGLKPAAVAANVPGMFWSFADNQEQEVRANIMVPDDCDRSEYVYVCLGWSSPTTDAVCSWEIDYFVAAPDDGVYNPPGRTVLDDLVTSSATQDGLVMTVWDDAGDEITVAADDICIHLTVRRKGAAVADTLGDVARLHGIALRYTSNKLGIAT